MRYVSLIFFLFCLWSCSNDFESLSGVWVAESLESGSQACEEELLDDYILDIDATSESYGLQLDINGCSGLISKARNGEINFKPGACTEACCDSDGAICLLQVLSRVERYEFDGDRLILSTSSAEIIFRAQ